MEDSMNEQTSFKGVSNMPFAKRYDNFIGGKWVPPQAGRYFQNSTPITGMDTGEIARSDEADVNLALDAGLAGSGRMGMSAFGGTAILIMVSVALTTVKQIESQLLQSNYEGLLR